MLEIQKLIRNNPDTWRNILMNSPYMLKISQLNDMDNRIMFKYRQGVSDYSYEIVKEARGLILDKDTFEVISMGFKKFFLCDSEFADKVDWNTLQVQEKFDGSLITLYYYNSEWIASTTGTIDATYAPISQGTITNFKQLFDIACSNSNLDYSRLNTNYCYMFELISPYNKQVVQYDTTKIIHIGTRDRTSLCEVDVNIGIRKPNVYSVANLDNALSIVNSDDFDGEGFVAVDNDYNRIKIKSDKWFKWHYMLNNNSMNISRALDILFTDDSEEFVARYPLYKDYFNNVFTAYQFVLDYVSKVIIYAEDMLKKFNNRSDIAVKWSEFISSAHDNEKQFLNNFKSAYFGRIDDINYNAEMFIKHTSKNKFAEIIKQAYTFLGFE